MYYLGSPLISLSPLDLLSPILSKYRGSTVYRPLLSAVSQLSSLVTSFRSLLCRLLLNIDSNSQLNSRLTCPFAFWISLLDLHDTLNSIYFNIFKNKHLSVPPSLIPMNGTTILYISGSPDIFGCTQYK